MKTTTIFFFTLLVFFQSCKKHVLEDEIVGEPPFYIEGTINNQTMNLVGGIDNVVFQPSHAISNNGLATYTASISNSNESLIIELIGNADAPSLSINDLIPIGEYEVVNFQQDTALGFLEITSNYPDQTNIIIVNANNDVFYQGESGGITSFLPDGDYSLNIIFNTNVNFYTYNFSIINGKLCGSAPQIKIENNVLSFYPSNVTGSSYDLIINNTLYNNISLGDEFDLTNLLPPSEPVVLIALNEISQNNCTSESFWFFTPDIVGDFNNQLTIKPALQEPTYSEQTCRISYHSPDGKEYSSLIDDSNLFQITQIDPYLDDPNGLEAYKIQIQANVKLINIHQPDDMIDLFIENGAIPIVNE